jgi:hypothetical protein
MTDIETYNYFICNECDPECKTRMSSTELKEHLLETHGIETTQGLREMVMHADAAKWFSWTYKWTIGGKVFTQFIKQARGHKFEF